MRKCGFLGLFLGALFISLYASSFVASAASPFDNTIQQWHEETYYENDFMNVYHVPKDLLD